MNHPRHGQLKFGTCERSRQRPLVVKHDAHKRTVNVHTTAVVVNEAQVPESIHKEADARTRGAYHFGEGFLAHFRHDRNRLRFLAKVGEQ